MTLADILFPFKVSFHVLASLICNRALPVTKSLQCSEDVISWLQTDLIYGCIFRNAIQTQGGSRITPTLLPVPAAIGKESADLLPMVSSSCSVN